MTLPDGDAPSHAPDAPSDAPDPPPDGDERTLRLARTLREVGRGVIGLVVVAVVVALLAGVAWADLPLAWPLGGVAVGFALLGTADLLEARVAGRRVRRAEEFEQRYG